jgi:formylglycine-generating enzyme required for sulfatase activity
MGSEVRFGSGVVVKKAMTMMQLALCFLFVFCNNGGGQTIPSELVGRWVDANGEGKGKEMELFKDGTGVAYGNTISWKVAGKRFVMTATVLGSSVSHVNDYKLSGYMLIFPDGDGTNDTLVRKEKWAEFNAKRVAAAEAEKAKQVAAAEAERKRIIEESLKQFVSVSGGTFTMGCTAEQGGDCAAREKPAHTVTLKDFSIGKYEVTQALWQAVMDENPSEFKAYSSFPVESVSWNDVQGFIQKLNEETGKKYRLPTEAEWEYAARGGNKSKGYKYSGGNDIDAVAWYDKNNGQTRVGTKQANELGLYDMTGNVEEWVSDWYGENYYSTSVGANPTGPNSGSYRVSRGGGWTGSEWYDRVSIRQPYEPDYRRRSLGFRLAISP